jgi:hypothetical protein
MKYQALWTPTTKIPASSYKCAYCDIVVSANDGLLRQVPPTTGIGSLGIGYELICICPNCERPTYIKHPSGQTPSPLPGNSVDYLPEGINALFHEARAAFSAKSYTASVLVCRTLLMHVAVEKGAETNKSFVYYVNYLDENRYITVDSKPWVDEIRQLANHATHEIVLMDEHKGSIVLDFTEMLLRLVYEFPNRLRRSR